MLIRAGYDISLHCEAATPMIAFLSVHPSRAADIRSPSRVLTSAGAPARTFSDQFGNLCTRTIAPAGTITLSTDFVIEDGGLADEVAYDAPETPGRGCPRRRAQVPAREPLLRGRSSLGYRVVALRNDAPGWARVQAIVDFVHNHITFGYQHARPTRSAWGATASGVGVCRDFAHLAVAFCRAMNIPARYCTGYLGDIGIPPVDAPMDFSAWFEVFLGDRWYTFDARHNVPRVGRILIARGRDAADVAITTTFGRSTLVGFRVFTDAL